jgi:hypothetical protein
MENGNLLKTEGDGLKLADKLAMSSSLKARIDVNEHTFKG